jgi:hypothetical protein
VSCPFEFAAGKRQVKRRVARFGFRPGEKKKMGTLEWVILIVVLLVLFGGGGGYYYSRRRG